jgi:hypothetical protein
MHIESESGKGKLSALRREVPYGLPEGSERSRTRLAGWAALASSISPFGAAISFLVNCWTGRMGWAPVPGRALIDQS